jgi:hypothetical protein
VASQISRPEEVRQRRAAESVLDVGENRFHPVSTPVSSAFAAGHIKTGQRCGKGTQHCTRKPGPFVTPTATAVILARNLLCTVQRQICTYFSQSMNSF